MNESRRLLQHFLAALAYRTQKALRDAPAGFDSFRAGTHVRTPHELVWHMTGVIGYARTFLHGGEYAPSKMPTFPEEVDRFHEALAALRDDLADEALEARLTDEQFLQGPLADAMTHAGQLAMLRRLAGAPVPSENFIHAAVRAENVGTDQPAPAAPDPWWRADQPPLPPGPIRDVPPD
ncbi:MAG: DinB family protein [Acidobacteriota bacterium]